MSHCGVSCRDAVQDTTYSREKCFSQLIPGSGKAGHLLENWFYFVNSVIPLFDLASRKLSVKYTSCDGEISYKSAAAKIY